MFGFTEPIVQKPTLSVCRRSAVVRALTSAESPVVLPIALASM